MNRNTTIVLALIAAGALVLGAIYVPPLLDEVFGEKPPMSTSVEFFDKDGNLVATSETPMVITAGGAEVETMTVKAVWTVDATDIDPATFNANIRIDLAVSCLTNTYEQLDIQYLDSSVMVSTEHPDANWQGFVEVHTWTLATLLQEYMTDTHKAEGWRLQIKATLTPTAKDWNGVEVVPDSPTQSAPVVYADLTWVYTTGLMTIVAFEIDRWLPPAP